MSIDLVKTKSRVLALAEQGYGYKKIAAMIRSGISPYTVRGWIRRQKAKSSPSRANSPGRLSEADKQEIRRLYLSGMSIEDIADRFSKSKQTLRKFLLPQKRMNLGPTVDPAILARAIRLFDNGYRLKEISTALGISENCARSWRLAWRTGRLQQRSKSGDGRLPRAVGNRGSSPEKCENPHSQISLKRVRTVSHAQKTGSGIVSCHKEGQTQTKTDD